MCVCSDHDKALSMLVARHEDAKSPVSAIACLSTIHALS
jgi:hypothetical protein